MKFVNVEKGTHRIMGWYSTEINKVIPVGAIEVLDSDWQGAIAINANYRDPITGEFLAKELRTTEEIERDRVANIKLKAKAIIYEKYSQTSQNNLAFLAESDVERTTAVTWINNIRAISKAAIASGEIVTDVEWALS